MSLQQTPPPLYPLDPYEQWDRIRQELASVAQCIGEDLRARPTADLTYWLERCEILSAWNEQLGDVLQKRSQRAAERRAQLAQERAEAWPDEPDLETSGF